MKKVLLIFGSIISASLIFAGMDDAKACSEIFISKSGKVNVSARNFDFFTAGDGIIRFSPAIASIDRNKLSGIMKESSYIEILQTVR